MKNFIDLNEIENNEVIKVKIKSSKPIIEEIDSILPKIDLSERLDQEEICVIDGDASEYYGDREENGSFKIKNLFSELVNEYERATARQNLGIGDEQTLNWGKIKGNIRNQEDLADYVFNSPKFKGVPTAPTQSDNNSSEALATTRWVINYINQNHISGDLSMLNPPGLQYLSINPNKGIKGDEPIEVLLKWDYFGEVPFQKLNSEILNPNIREKILILSKDTPINLEYRYEDKVYHKDSYFKFHNPFYYGSDLNNLYKTTSKSFLLNSGLNEYVYIKLPINDANLAVNGLIGGFEIINEENLHDTIYYIYRTINHSLGKLTINLII